MSYTQMPNEILEMFMNNTLTNADKKIFAVVIRKTLGFHKQWDLISFSQLERLTGLTRQSINESTTRLVKQGLLLKRTGNAKKPNSWAIASQFVDTLGNQPYLTSQPEVVTPSRLTKEIQNDKNVKPHRGGDITEDDLWNELINLSDKQIAKERGTRGY